MNIGDNCKIVTGPDTKWVYVHIWRPEKTRHPFAQPKYSVRLMIPKSDTVTINAIQKAMKAAYEEKQQKLKTQHKDPLPPIESLPVLLRDGDEEYKEYENNFYKGYYFVNASNKDLPELVDAKGNPITDLYDIESGDFGRASISIFIYIQRRFIGFACRLDGLQKFQDA